MSSHFYEVALAGDFYAKDLKAILNRTALHSESAGQMHTREMVLEPLDASQLRATGQEPVLLRARKELLEKGAGWYVRVPSVSREPWSLISRHAQDPVLVSEARVRARAAGRDRAPVGDGPGHRRRAQLRVRARLHVSVPPARGRPALAPLTRHAAAARSSTNAGTSSGAGRSSSRSSSRSRRVCPLSPARLRPWLTERARARTGGPSDGAADPGAPGHAVGGRGEERDAGPEHARGAAQPDGRCRARGAAPDEGPSRPPSAGRLSRGC